MQNRYRGRIKVPVTLGESPELLRLSYSLRVDRATALGHVVIFWSWCRNNARDGDITGIEPATLAFAAGWDGDCDEFCDAMADAGFLRDMQVTGARHVFNLGTALRGGSRPPRLGPDGLPILTKRQREALAASKRRVQDRERQRRRRARIRASLEEADRVLYSHYRANYRTTGGDDDGMD